MDLNVGRESYSHAQTLGTLDRLTFDPALHLYRVDGKIIESVTQTLAGIGIINSDWYPETACVRGLRVHEGTQIIEGPGLDWDSLVPIEEALEEIIIPRCHAWELFLNRTGWRSRKIERRNFHPTYLYGMTTDRIGKFPGDRAETVLDIKTGAKEKWWGWQTGAYELGERAHDGQRRHRLCVELCENGKYKKHHHEDEEDAEEFVDILSAYRAGRRKGYFELIPNMEKLDI